MDEKEPDSPPNTELLNNSKPERSHRKRKRTVMRVAFYLTIAVILFFLIIEAKYQHNTSIKARVTEGLSLAGQVKRAIHEYYDDHQSFPSTNQEVDLPEPTAISGNDVKSIAVSDDGVITIKYYDKAPELKGLSLKLVPKEVNGEIIFTCHGSKTHYKYLPLSCRN